MKAELLLVLVGLALCCDAANILVMLPLPTFSHTNSFKPIFEELARRGHNVTVVSPYPRKEPLANYTDIVVPNTIQQVFSAMQDPREMQSVILNFLGISAICPLFMDLVLPLPELQAFIKDDRSHFDLVITETFFCQEPLTAMAHKYNAHLVGIAPLPLSPIDSDYTGNTLPLSYVSHIKVMAGDRMDFWQRFLNVLYSNSERFFYYLLYKDRQEEYMRKYIQYPGSEGQPPLDDLLGNHSLILVDSHLSLSYPRPLQPNVVEFGGLTAMHDPNPLPKDLEEFMSGAKEGVIYLSWGSVWKSTNMDNATLAKFLTAFSRMKQCVLMKWENPDLPGKPDNVKIAPWFPQSSVLAHPKLVAFISHGGTHGVSEATYNAVPILGTPLFGDQQKNIRLVEAAGYGLYVNLETFTVDELVDGLNKLIYDPQYKRSAVRRSLIMRDRPLPPLENAVYWIEYVLRHDGARHLRSTAADLPLYQYLLLDVIGAVLAALLAVALLLALAARTVYRTCCSRGADKAKKKSKKA